ncbi:hypothetical protein BDR04DRAFT_579884 [Suillus decipiens]|nr:hypothetical protein BDR04DRAFT_579884 [Suillus decipiens]
MFTFFIPYSIFLLSFSFLSLIHPFQQYSQVPPSVPPNPPSTQILPPQPSQEPTGQALVAQRTTQLISGQFPIVQAEHQYSAQQSQPHFSPPPTQSQFQVQETQFPPTHQFPQSQAQARPQSQFSQAHHPQVPSQSHAHTHIPTQSRTHAPSQSHTHPHVQSHTQSQPQVHAPPNLPQQSQHYSGLPDSYYLQSDMYYLNTQGSQSASSLHSIHAPTSTPHAHSISPHSPFATFGSHTPPTPSGDAGACIELRKRADRLPERAYFAACYSFRMRNSRHRGVRLSLAWTPALARLCLPGFVREPPYVLLI